MMETRSVRTLDVSAASGQVMRNGLFHVIADDESSLSIFGADGATCRVALLHGELPEKKSERTTVMDTSVLYAGLGEAFPELNLEGAAQVGDEFVLLQCDNRSDQRTALICIAMHDLRRVLVSSHFAVTGAPRIVDVKLGMHDQIPWSCTELTLCADRDLLACAVLEDTEHTHQDGTCLGSALVRMAPDDAPRWHRQLDEFSEVEGVALDREVVWLVSDADDRALPSQFLCIGLS